jgi:hypothetical protein
LEVIEGESIPLERVVRYLLSDAGLDALLPNYELACFVLARAGLVPQFYQQLIQNIDTIDATTRSHVAFIIFHGDRSGIVDMRRGRPERHQVIGLSISKNSDVAIEDDSHILNAALSRDSTDRIREDPSSAPVSAISRATDLAGSLLMARFNVWETDLPCLLFVQKSRLEEAQIVRLSADQPMKSLYEDVLAPLSDEIRSLEVFQEQARKIDNHLFEVGWSSEVLASFDGARRKLEQDLERARLEVVATDDTVEFVKLTEELATLKAYVSPYESAISVDDKIALMPVTDKVRVKVVAAQERLTRLENEKRNLESGMSEGSTRGVSQLASTIDNLKKRIPSLLRGPYDSAKAKIRRLEGSIENFDTPKKRFQRRERDLVNEIVRLNGRREEAEEARERSGRFDLGSERLRADQMLAALKQRYGDVPFASRTPFDIDMIKSLVQQQRIGAPVQAKARHQAAWRSSVAPNRKALLMFVHGLGGRSETTWGQLPTFLNADDEVANRFDVRFFSFPTSLIRLPFMKRASKIQELADGLRTQIDHEPYDRISLVCHSLGGLVARRYLVEEVKRKAPLKVDRMALFAVPNNGAELATVAQYLSWRQQQIRQLCTNSDVIEFLNEDWVTFDVQSKIRLKFVIGTEDRVVDRFSAKGYWGNADTETIIGRGHIDIVKPDHATDLTVTVLRNFLLD